MKMKEVCMTSELKVPEAFDSAAQVLALAPLKMLLQEYFRNRYQFIQNKETNQLYPLL